MLNSAHPSGHKHILLVRRSPSKSWGFTSLHISGRMPCPLNEHVHWNTWPVWPALFGQTRVQRNFDSLSFKVKFSDQRSPKAAEIMLNSSQVCRETEMEFILLTATEPNYGTSLKLHLFPLKIILTFFSSFSTSHFSASLFFEMFYWPVRGPSGCIKYN